MSKEDRKAVQAMALEFALKNLVRLLENKGALAQGEFAQALQAQGTSLVMDSALGFTQDVGREMVEVAKRIN